MTSLVRNVLASVKQRAQRGTGNGLHRHIAGPRRHLIGACKPNCRAIFVLFSMFFFFFFLFSCRFCTGWGWERSCRLVWQRHWRRRRTGHSGRRWRGAPPRQQLGCVGSRSSESAQMDSSLDGTLHSGGNRAVLRMQISKAAA